jgi:HlyD family secretion protein
MRRVLVVLLVLVVVLGGSWLGYEKLGVPQKTKAAAVDYQVLPIKRGNIEATVSATGSVLPEREASLSFQSTGTIVTLTVKAGDSVRAGQLLAQLDTQDLELAVNTADVGLRTAEAQVRQLLEAANAVDVAAAQAQLNSAQAAYQQVLDGSDQDEQASAKAQVQQAKVTLDQAQQAYDKVKDEPNVGMLPQALQLQQATINYETAQAQFRVTTRGAKTSQLASAQAQVAQAQAALDKLQRGPSPSQVDIAKASLDQARLTLQQAQRKLDNARLVAPWAGVVTAVNIVEGTAAALAAPAVQLADISLYHINVRVDEADIASIAEGQPVSIELDAYAGQKLLGHVARIAPSASNSATGGVVGYEVRIDIDPTSVRLLSGMSATATITSSRRENVLLVSNRAIQIERDTGKAFVERLNKDVPQKVEVRLGLRDDQYSEVRDGLGDGDQIVLRNVSSLEKLQQSMNSGG